MTGIIRDILYRILDEPSERRLSEYLQREREVVALEKIAKSAEREQSK